MISRTLAQIATHQTWIPWVTCMGLIIFLAFFVGMLVWTARKENQLLYQDMSRMPLEDERSEYRAIEVKL